MNYQAPQAAIDTREDNIVVENVKIDFEFGEEPTIELTSFY